MPDKQLTIKARLDTSELEQELEQVRSRLEQFASEMEAQLSFRIALQTSPGPSNLPPVSAGQDRFSQPPVFIGQNSPVPPRMPEPGPIMQPGPQSQPAPRTPEPPSPSRIPSPVPRLPDIEPIIGFARQVLPMFSTLLGASALHHAYELGSNLALQAGAIGMQAGGVSPDLVWRSLFSQGAQYGISASQMAEAVQLQGQFAGTGSIAILFRDATQTALFARSLGINIQSAAQILGGYQQAGAFQPGQEASAAQAITAAASASGVNAQMFATSLQQLVTQTMRTSIYTPENGPAQTLTMINQLGNKLNAPLLQGAQGLTTLQTLQQGFDAGPGQGSGLTAEQLLPVYEAVRKVMAPQLEKMGITNPVLQLATIMRSNVLETNKDALAAALGAIHTELAKAQGTPTWQLTAEQFSRFVTGDISMQGIRLMQELASPDYQKVINQILSQKTPTQSAEAQRQQIYSHSIAQQAQNITSDIQRVLGQIAAPELQLGSAVGGVFAAHPGFTATLITGSALYGGARMLRGIFGGRLGGGGGTGGGARIPTALEPPQRIPLESPQPIPKPPTSGLVDQYGKPLPSSLTETEAPKSPSLIERVSGALKGLSRVVEEASPVTNVLKRFGGPLLGAALEAPSTIHDIASGHAGRGIGGLIGSVSGGWGGALAGAALAAPLDPFTFGLASVVGGIIGGIGGGWLGKKLGQAAGSAIQGDTSTTSSSTTQVSSQDAAGTAKAFSDIAQVGRSQGFQAFVDAFTKNGGQLSPIALGNNPSPAQAMPLPGGMMTIGGVSQGIGLNNMLTNVTGPISPSAALALNQVSSGPPNIQQYVPLINKIAAAVGVPANYLGGIMEQESGGNPYSIYDDTARKSYPLHSLSEYLSVGQQLLAEGHNIDAGLMQINLQAHPNVSLLQAADPTFALQFAAQLLKFNYSQTGSWEKAIEAYNGGLGGVGTPATIKYAQSVMNYASLFSSGGSSSQQRTRPSTQHNLNFKRRTGATPN